MKSIQECQTFLPKSIKLRTSIDTMRWRPTFTQEEVDAFGMKDKLFHPIKGYLYAHKTSYI